MKTSKLLSVALSVLIALAVLTGSIAVPLLCRSFYYAHIGPMRLEEYGLSREEIKTAYNQMMDFCLGRRENFAAGVLAFSQSGADHFADVRGLFLLDLRVLMAALTAMQIILARFLSIQVSDTLRISFESIPVILAGMWLGPIPGAIVAVVADFLGTILSGYGTWFPPLVLGPLSVGILSGVSTKYIFRSPLAETRDTWKVAVIVVTVGILNSFVFGLIGSTMYSILVAGNTTAFPVLMWTNLIQRLATKPLTIAVNAVAVTIVNRAVYKPVVRQILSRA